MIPPVLLCVIPLYSNNTLALKIKGISLNKQHLYNNNVIRGMLALIMRSLASDIDNYLDLSMTLDTQVNVINNI